MDSTTAEKKKIAALQKTIQNLQEQISHLRTQLACLLMRKQGLDNYLFRRDLSFGLRHSKDVKALQIFLMAQGKTIYPEGLVTGNFLELTKQAVVRFQEKYYQDILQPLGLNQGTGFVGERTRKKINELLKACWEND